MFYIKLIFNLVLLVSRFTRLLISSFLNAVSEQLILYWKYPQKSHVLDNLHLRHDLDEINEVFYPSNENPSVKVQKEGNVVVENGLQLKTKDEYIDLLIKVKYEAANVRRRVDNYTQDQITILDKDIHNAKLEKIDEENMAFQDWIASYSSILDEENVSSDLIMILETIRVVADELNNHVRNNATDVKRKLIELLRENDENLPISTAAKETFDLERQKLERKKMVDMEKANEKKQLVADARSKILKRLEHVSRDAEELSSKIFRLKDVNEMTEHEISIALLDSIKWNEDMKAVERMFDTLEVDSVGTEFDQQVMKEVHGKIKLLGKSLDKKIDDLLRKDKELCLYTLSPEKMKRVHYSQPFSGEANENVYTFIADIKQAMNDDCIRTKDKLKVLLKYVEGDAKMSVLNAENVDDAFDILDKTFGTPRLIWKKKMENFEKYFDVKNVWGAPDSVKRRNAIARMIDFLNEAAALSKHHNRLKEILDDSTFKTIFNLLPWRIRHDIARQLQTDSSNDEKFYVLQQVLKDQRDSTVWMVDMSICRVSQNDVPKSSSHKVPVKTVKPVKYHSCDKSPQCKSECGVLGCVKLYRKSIDERLSFLRKEKCCTTCGSKFVPGHKCRWNGKMLAVKCSVRGCKCAAAVCKAHVNTRNASPELSKWLWKNNISNEVNVFRTPVKKTRGKREPEKKKSNNGILPRSNSFDMQKLNDDEDIDVIGEDDEQATDITDAVNFVDGQVNADGIDAPRMVGDDNTDGSDHERVAVRATANSSKCCSVNTDRKLSNVMTSPKVTTGKFDGHNHPVTKSQALMTVPNGDGSLIFKEKGNLFDEQNHNDGFNENGTRKVLRFSSHTSIEKEYGLVNVKVTEAVKPRNPTFGEMMNCEVLKGEIETFNDAPDNVNFNPRMKSFDEENCAPGTRNDAPVAENVKDVNTYHVDKRKKVGNENDDVSDDENVVTRGKPCSSIKCLPVEAKPNKLSNDALPNSSNFIENQTENIATFNVEDSFDSKFNVCPFDNERNFGNVLIDQQGSEGKCFDIHNSTTSDDKNVKNVENDNVIESLKFQEDFDSNQSPLKPLVVDGDEPDVRDIENGSGKIGKDDANYEMVKTPRGIDAYCNEINEETEADDKTNGNSETYVIERKMSSNVTDGTLEMQMMKRLATGRMKVLCQYVAKTFFNVPVIRSSFNNTQ